MSEQPATQRPDVRRYPQPLTLAQLRARRRDPFRLPGLVHSAMTGFVGEPYAGKSSLSANLIASAVLERDFLGVPWDAYPDRVVLVCTDPGNAAEYSERLHQLGVAEDDERVTVFESAPTGGEWPNVRDDFGLTADSLVVVDNLMGVAPDVNSTKDVGAFFDGLQQGLCAHGVAVVVVAHKSEKFGDRGRSRTPMGSTGISAKFRHVVYVDPRPGNGVSLRVRGNQIAGEQTWALSRGAGAADLRVLSSEEVVARDRSKETMDRYAEIAAWVVSECQGLNKQTTADRVAARFGGKRDSWAKQMQPARRLGKLLSHSGGDWGLAT